MKSQNPLGLCLVLICLGMEGTVFAQGPLTPPGAPAPTMKTLAQIEPRTPISSLPYTITNSGSYYLTTNLTGTNGILIQTSHVTLDLNGFSLMGANTNASVNGINVDVLIDICVRNGTVCNWGGSGVNALYARNSRLCELNVSGNGEAGLLCGQGGSVDHCVAKSNRGYGIFASSGTIINCSSTGNQSAGIYAGSGSTVTGCSATDNFIGITVGNGCPITGCTATYNNGNGIELYGRDVVSDCTVSGNTGNGILTVFESCTIKGCTVSGNTGDGIEVTSRCRVVDNTCTKNGNGNDAGIRVTGDGSRIEANHVANNNYGIKVEGLKNFILRNSASGNTVAEYNWVAGNHPTPVSSNSITAGALDNFDQ